MKSVEEKLKFNNEQKTPFSLGYVLGVNAYRGYLTANEEQKKRIKTAIDHNKKNAIGDTSRGGVQYSKGFMCAVRDCANERKGKKQ